MSSLRGPLAVEGGDSGSDRSLKAAVLLPKENNGPLFAIGAQPPEQQQIDVLNIFGDYGWEDTSGTLTATRLTGFNMAGDLTFSGGTAFGETTVVPGGISYRRLQVNASTGRFETSLTQTTIEVLNLMLNSGNNTLTIESTLDTDADHGGLTVVHGGGNRYRTNPANGQCVLDTLGQKIVGGDTILVRGGGGPESPLVIYGDTSQDGVWYSGDPTISDGRSFVAKRFDQVGTEDDFFIFPLANPFDLNGNDTIDARTLFAGVSPMPNVGVTIYGGPNNDLLYGSQTGDHIAGGSGDDEIHGQSGFDHIYGNSGVNVDILTRVLAISTVEPNPNPSFPPRDTLVAGRDLIRSDAGDDIIFGDHGIVIQDVAASQKILTTRQVRRIESAQPTNGDVDTIIGSSDDQTIFGGPEGDIITAGDGANIVFGDHGVVDFSVADGDQQIADFVGDIDRITSIDPAFGGRDNITTGTADDIVLGGQDNDTIHASVGQNIVFGDNGQIIAAVANSPRFGAQNLTLGRIETTAFNIGGDDQITTLFSRDIVLGGDDGQIVFDADLNSGDVDDIISTSTNLGGGTDTITTSNGEDVILGGRFGDSINAGHGRNIIIGDSGRIRAHTADSPRQFPGQPITVALITTTAPGDGGNDTILTGNDEDIVLAGMAADNVTTNAANDIVLGDNGRVDYVVNDGNAADIDLITTSDPNQGGNDGITAGTQNDIVLAGTANDIVSGNEHNDLIFGDHGKVEGDISASLLPLNMPLAQHPFARTSIDTQNSPGGGTELLHGNSGQDIILGGQDGDRITGGTEDDDIIGGHNVPGGHDGGDFIDAGTHNDVVAGDNANLLRTETAISPRMRVLSGQTIFDANGNALITSTHQMNPTGATERFVVLFDHSFSPLPDTFGNDTIAVVRKTM